MEPLTLLLIGFVILVVTAAASLESARKQELLNDSRNSYTRALATLKEEPANPELRQHALQAGRAYSHLSRDSKGVAIFDEVALMNDLSAACAATAVAVRNGSSTRQKLAELRELRESQLISEGEYEKIRSGLLQDLSTTAAV